ncbi:uncharacterized protein LOC117647163 [Thrips palmi]|uniref:Uncharacterized protein LOC117647163 n=1 Tax=Thrips palmi TaxID=161013 RepID=A0A6P8YWV7_THRPL|nr:uncharacterized protein LOC117647163 [Thrips palmi]
MAVTVTQDDVQAAFNAKFGCEVAIESWKQVSVMEDGRLGFLGDHFKVKARARVPASAAEARDVSLFVKGLPENDKARATVVNTGAFKKEALFYQLFAKDMTAALGGAAGPDCQPFVFPQCHLVKDDCLLLDDLGPFGFAGMEAREPLPLEHIRLVVKALGELHAASLVLEERRGRTLLAQFPEIGYETFFTDDPKHTNATWHRASINVCVAIVPHLDKYRDLDKDTLARIQAALPPLLHEVLQSLGTWEGVRNVMCHGDSWTNNFMFRKDASGRPVEVALVDYQLARYAPPPNDLAIMLFFCSDRAFQEKHWAELKRLHWDSIAAGLRRAGCEPEKVLPWSQFESVADKMYKYGLLLMALEQPFSLAPSSLMDPLLEDPDKFYHHCHVDRTETIINMYKTDELFRSRYNQTMERIIDTYILAA